MILRSMSRPAAAELVDGSRVLRMTGGGLYGGDLNEPQAMSISRLKSCLHRDLGSPTLQAIKRNYRATCSFLEAELPQAYK